MDRHTKHRHTEAKGVYFEEEARDFVNFVKNDRDIRAAVVEEDSPAAGKHIVPFLPPFHHLQLHPPHSRSKYTYGVIERRRRRATQEENKPLHKSENLRLTLQLNPNLNPNPKP
jgi:hypothetical protein